MNAKLNHVVSREVNEQDRKILGLLSILGAEGIQTQIFFRTIRHPNRPLLTEQLDNLMRLGWVTASSYDTIRCHELACAITIMPDASSVNSVLSALACQLKARPQEYLVPARLFLSYLINERRDLLSSCPATAGIFARTVIAFVPYVEMSLSHNKRMPVECVEERLDYRLLDCLIRLKVEQSHGEVCRMMGEIYNVCFRYEEAERCLAESQSISGTDAALLMARARMHHNLGSLGKAVHLAHQAYEHGLQENNNTVCTDACIMLSYLCALVKDMKSSRHWLGKITATCRSKVQKLRIDAIRSLQNMAIEDVAMEFVDRAELAALRVFGDNAPELGQLAYIRSLILIEAGKLEEGDHQYRIYIENNRYNYGYSAGAEIALLACMVNERICLGDMKGATERFHRMTELNSRSVDIAPGVRMSMALVSCIFLASTGHSVPAMRHYHDAHRLCLELNPDGETCKELADVFIGGRIPPELMHKDILHSLSLQLVLVFICEEQYEKALTFLERVTSRERDESRRISLNIQKAFVLVLAGWKDKGIRIWNAAIRTSPDEMRFEVLSTIAHMAAQTGLEDMARNLLENAFSHDYMKYASKLDIDSAREQYRLLCGNK